MKLITAQRLVTGRPGEVLRDAGVLVDGRSIVWVGEIKRLEPERRTAAEVIDYIDATLLPGLVDSHVHLGFDGGPTPVQRMMQSTDPELLVLMLNSAEQLLSAGVTTARDLGARGFLDVTVRDAIASGLSVGPRMVVANRPITVTGGHCWFMGCECDSLDAVRQMVRLHHKMGADVIKVMATGGFMTSGSAPWHAQFSLEELKTIVHEAHRLGKKVAAHAHGTPGIRLAVEAGVDTIEHCSWIGEGGIREFDVELMDRIAEKGIYVCPTTNSRAQTFSPGMWEERASQLDQMRKAGVRIIAGTDAGIDLTPHREYVGGLEALVASGMPNLEAIEAATSRAASALNLGDITGTLQPGKDADLIVVSGDPLAEIGNLRHLELVMTRGRAFDVARWRPYEKSPIEADPIAQTA